MRNLRRGRLSGDIVDVIYLSHGLILFDETLILEDRQQIVTKRKHS